MYKQQMMFHR